MSEKKKRRTPYSSRTDIGKIRSNWTKVKGLFAERQWSSAIVRAATAAEIAANYAIRQELVEIRGLDAHFVDHLLKWANGLHGKLTRILVPVVVGDEWHATFSGLVKIAADINGVRNRIVHSGQFKKKSTAVRVIKEAEAVINTLIEPYDKFVAGRIVDA